MDLSVIGAHCEAHRCGDLDLLPIKCGSCQKLFCRHHITPDSHSCSSLATDSNTNIPEDSPNSGSICKRERCAFQGCQKPTLESVIVDTTEPEHRVVAVCAHCSGAFCAVHRHPSDHACPSISSASSPAQRNPEAHKLLSEHFPATGPPRTSPSASKPSKPPTDPKKLARLRAVELMKMRHHALPVDSKDQATSVPLTHRLHVKVVVDGANPPVEKTFWLRKTLGTGRALDLIASQLSIRISDTMPAYLEKEPPGSEFSTRLKNDKLLSEQVEDGETLILSVGTQPTTS